LARDLRKCGNGTFVTLDRDHPSGAKREQGACQSTWTRANFNDG